MSIGQLKIEMEMQSRSDIYIKKYQQTYTMKIQTHINTNIAKYIGINSQQQI